MDGCTTFHHYHAALNQVGTFIDEGTIQSGNSGQVPDEKLPLNYLQGQKDGLEWAAQMAEASHPQTGDWLYDDPVELAKAIRKGPDMPPVSDGWILVSERMPEVGSTIMVHMDNPQYSATDYAIATYDKYGFSRAKVTHWQPLPAPPKGV